MFLRQDDKTKEWKEAGLWQLKGTPPVTAYPVSVGLHFYVKDNRGRDIDNMIASVMDVLQAAEIIDNDDWQHCNRIYGEVHGIDKANPRVEITIMEDV